MALCHKKGSRMSKKIKIIFISLITLALIGGVVYGGYKYFNNQNQENNSSESVAINNRNVYTDKVYGFSFKYPENWFSLPISENLFENAYTKYYYDKYGFATSYSYHNNFTNPDFIEEEWEATLTPGNVMLKIFAFPTNQEELLVNNVYYMRPVENGDKSGVIIDGKEFTRVTGISKGNESVLPTNPDYKEESVIVTDLTNNYQVLLKLYYTNDDNNNFSDTFTNILSTFRFNEYNSDKIKEIFTKIQ